MKPTFVIAIADNHFMDNLNHIPRSMDVSLGDDVEVRIVTHTSPEWTHGKSGIKTNFDVLITNGAATTRSGMLWQNLLPEHRVHVSYRPVKMEMGINLKRWSTELGLKHFLPIPTHLSSFGDERQADFGHDMTGKVVIKPNQGARGVGHFVIDTDAVSMEVFLHDLNSIEYSDGQTTKDAISGLLEKYEPHVVYGAGAEDGEGEGLRLLSQQGFVTQALVKEVVNEFRVILDVNSMPALILLRARNDNTIVGKGGKPYLQATGVLNKLIDFHEVTWDQMVNMGEFNEGNISAVMEEMEKIFKKLPGLSSVDVFMTSAIAHYNDAWVGPRFGFFEYSNQFGTAGIPVTRSRRLHTNFANQLLVRYLAGEAK